jgi:hypothetical protein
MSFGFSVGDIILLSQLAYKLYSTITAGRRAATKDLQELADVLFGLRCALDHLGNAAKDVSPTASEESQATNAIEVQQKLHTMVLSCRATLQELDSVTKKYREAAELADTDVVDEDADFRLELEASSNPSKKRPIARFKEKARVNWMKIRWDMERNSLGEYRVKLQSHTDAINLVLTTFLWYVFCHSHCCQQTSNYS